MNTSDDRVSEGELSLGGLLVWLPIFGAALVAATERPVAELLRSCSLVDQFGTRLVLQTASEEDSVALVGMPGGERGCAHCTRRRV